MADAGEVRSRESVVRYDWKQMMKDEGFRPSEIAGISVFVIDSDEEKMGQKFDELSRVLEGCSGRGIVASFGDLEVLIGGDDAAAAGSYMVSKLTTLLEGFKEKLWLIGAVASYDVYIKGDV
ncbi:hypothetical protein LINGRAHAP2_LOCUS6781 [Linum grandiflorum]